MSYTVEEQRFLGLGFIEESYYIKDPLQRQPLIPFIH